MRAPAQIELQVVAVKKPEDLNLILGQSHFFKTVEDLHEARRTGPNPGGPRGDRAARPAAWMAALTPRFCLP